MFRKLRETKTLANELLKFGETQWIQDNNLVKVKLQKKDVIKSTNFFKVWSSIFKFIFIDKMQGERLRRYVLSVTLNHRTVSTKIFETEDGTFTELKNTFNEIVEYVSNIEANHTELNNELLEYMKKMNEDKFDLMFNRMELQLVCNNLDYTHKNVESLLRVLYVFRKFEKLTNWEKERYGNTLIQTIKTGIIPELREVDIIRSLEVDSALNRLKEMVEQEE